MAQVRSVGRHFHDPASVGTFTIQRVQKPEPSRRSAPDEPPPGLPMDESRLVMMRRVKRMAVEERIILFERLSRRVTWARSAKRVRLQNRW